MEEAILKYAELGGVGIFALIMLTQGLRNLSDLNKSTAALSEAQKALADSISKLSEKVNSFSFQLSSIEKRLDKIEENSVRNFSELRDLIKKERDERR